MADKVQKKDDESSTARNHLGDKNWYFTDTPPYFRPTIALNIDDYPSSKTHIDKTLSSVNKYVEPSLGTHTQ